MGYDRHGGLQEGEAVSMDVREIVKEWLKQHGYDGLYNTSGECACIIDDLFPCFSETTCFCKPGYYIPCPGSDGCDSAAYNEPCTFHIGMK